VGSASVIEYVHSQFENMAWWNRGKTYCGVGPFHHDIWRIYRTGGIQSCLNSSNYGAGYITVLRNPVDRLISQLLFFVQSLHKRLEQESAAHELAVYRELLFSPKNVTAENLQSLLNRMRSLVTPVHTVTPYEMVFSKSKLLPDFRPSSTGLKKALSRLNKDMLAVGTTESMPTFFVLLSRLFSRNVTSVVRRVRLPGGGGGGGGGGKEEQQEWARFGRWEGGPADEEEQVHWQPFNLTEACHLHLLHGLGDAFPVLRRFGTPSAEKLLNSAALALLRGQVRNEAKLWRRAEELHEEQLRAVGLSRAEALRVWEGVCRGVRPVRTEGELRKYRHVMKGTHRKNPLSALMQQHEGKRQRQRERLGKPGGGRPKGERKTPRSVSQTKQKLHYHQQGLAVGGGGEGFRGW
jgi:hypothetical protein